MEAALTIAMDLSIIVSGPKGDTPMSMFTSVPDLKVTPFPFSEGLARLLKLKEGKAVCCVITFVCLFVNFVMIAF